VSAPELRAGAAQALPAHLAPGPILLLGAPGVGKGTQAQELMRAWNIPQISTGDLLRDNKDRGTPLGEVAKQLMREGKLVPDDLVNQMVAERLKQPDTAAGYILDGFPRTLGQADWLDAQLAAQPAALPVIAISMHVGYNQLLRRITGRRICPVCKTIYNIYLQPPRADEICDIEGAKLVRRSDDTEEVFEERMRTYDSLTAPVVEHYRGLGRFTDVDGEQEVSAVTAGIMAAVVRLRS
jgi:adenylate kinase